ncbi:MAG: hypothetical protein IKL97_02765 [Eggerthellaceae bacterium]|nr:hypothetical protein [Eggerthellaceae bacterium]
MLELAASRAASRAVRKGGEGKRPVCEGGAPESAAPGTPAPGPASCEPDSREPASREPALESASSEPASAPTPTACGTPAPAAPAPVQSEELVLFMDPPRAGSTEQFLDAAASMAPERIVYISCNPETQVRDIAYLRKHGYHPKLVQPVDMFPHTDHVESIALLTRG